jgi:holo-[acyl-carrier protein] synthase
MSRPQGLILRKRLPEQVDGPPKQPNKQIPPRQSYLDINSVDGQICEVSISHDTHWATAVAIVPVLDDWLSIQQEGKD